MQEGCASFLYKFLKHVCHGLKVKNANCIQQTGYSKMANHSWHIQWRRDGQGGNRPHPNFYPPGKLSSCCKIFSEKASDESEFSPSNCEIWLNRAKPKQICIWVHFEVQSLYADRCTVWVNFRLFFYTFNMWIHSESPGYFLILIWIGTESLVSLCWKVLNRTDPVLAGPCVLY